MIIAYKGVKTIVTIEAFKQPREQVHHLGVSSKSIIYHASRRGATPNDATTTFIPHETSPYHNRDLAIIFVIGMYIALFLHQLYVVSFAFNSFVSLLSPW